MISMGYDIPDKIRYHEKIVANLDLKQLGYMIGFLILAGLAYGLPIMQEARLALAFILILTGVGFALFNFENILFDRWKYMTNIRHGGALDKRIRTFVGIRKIENNTIYMDNGEMRVIIQVTPINFELLDDGRQKSIILNYRDFLNQLSHPIQIVIRTVNVSLADYFSNHEARILKTKDDDIISLYNDFRNYEEKFLKDYFVKERLFYIVIPLDPTASQYSKLNVLQKKTEYSERQKDVFLAELGERVQIVQSKLGNCGLTTQRLNTNQLISLIMSYLEGYVEVNEDYLWRISVAESFFKERDKHG